jgi:glycosyltransferase involved in cell wall biosynthesis
MSVAATLVELVNKVELLALRLLRTRDVSDRARISVGFVITSFDPGGTERQMTELISRLDKNRFAVHVACFRRQGLWLERVERAAISVTEFPITGFRSPSTAFSLLRFGRWCRGHRIAVIQACDFYANVFGLTGSALARVPVRIGSRRDLVLPVRTAGQHRLQRLTYRLAHRIVANSHAAGAQVVDEGVPRSRLSVIPNGIDLSCYLPRSPRTQRRVVTTVANLRKEKGHEVLLDAAAIVARHFPDVTFRLAGGGPMRSMLEQQARALGLGSVVQFLGHREDVPAVLHEADVFVLPSRTEAFPNGLMEAMAASLPVVASDVGGIPELVEHERNGLLVPVGDAPALAAAIVRLARESELADSLARAARQTIESRYAFDRMVASFEALYEGEVEAAAAVAVRRGRDMPVRDQFGGRGPLAYERGDKAGGLARHEPASND